MAAHHWLIYHGRKLCRARKPLCEECFLNHYVLQLERFNMKVNNEEFIALCATHSIEGIDNANEYAF